MIDRERDQVQSTRAQVKQIFSGAMARWLTESKSLASKVGKANAMVKVPTNALLMTKDEVEEVIEALAEMARDGAVESLMALFGADLDVDVINRASDMAETWARNYGGVMISEIEETTRGDVSRIIGDAMEGGWSNDKVASALDEGYAFSDDRADMIARTETAYADVAGNVASYEEAGVERKRWVLGSDSCDLCQANEDAGEIDFNDTFPSGDFAPPGHPNCTCDIIPVLD